MVQTKRHKCRRKCRRNRTKKQRGGVDYNKIFISFIKGILEKSDTGFMFNPNDNTDIIKIHEDNAKAYISKHIYNITPKQSASIKEHNQYTKYSLASRALNSIFGIPTEGKRKGKRLGLLDIKKKRINITDKGMKLLNKKNVFHTSSSSKKRRAEPSLRSLQDIGRSPSLSLLQENPVAPSTMNLLSTPFMNGSLSLHNELQRCKSSLSFADKEIQRLKLQNDALIKDMDMWSQKDSEHEAELLDLIEIINTGKKNEEILQKNVNYLQQQNAELKDQLELLRGSSNLLSFTDASKDALGL